MSQPHTRQQQDVALALGSNPERGLTTQEAAMRLSRYGKNSLVEKTALQITMKQLSKTLVWVALFFAILIPVLSYARGLSGLESTPAGAVLYGLSLAFVLLPKELPKIITTVFGVGSYTLSRKGVIVKRLSAAETLGNVTVIATDKTGTITENKMRVEHLYFDGTLRSSGEFKENEKAALRTAFLASDAAGALDNPLFKAILERLKQGGVDPQTLTNGWVLKDELSFDVKRKLASYVYQYGTSTVVLSSGAPEKILERSNRILLEGQEANLTDALRIEVSKTAVQMAHTGERLLAFGYHRISPGAANTDIEQEIVLVGIIGFINPPRREVVEAIKTCQQAGIRVIMITGDHPETAKTIAGQVSINNTRVLTGSEMATMNDGTLKDALRNTHVFSRVTPEDKLRLVRFLKANGEIIAVTGEGINDAPALKEAHIGIALGVRGTDVTKEAASMILVDDNFARIETAVSEGRRLYSNLRKGVRYYLASKVAFVSIFLIPIILGIPLPFSPIQIIVLGLFMDLAASATFVAEPQEKGAMKKPPNDPAQKFMDKRMLRPLFLGALSLFAAVTATYLFTYFTAASTMNLEDVTLYARTVAFATWIFGHIFLALNLRSENTPLLKQGILTNKVILLWALLVMVVLGLGINLPLMQSALQITVLEPSAWALAIGVSFVATFWMELKKMLTGKI